MVFLNSYLEERETGDILIWREVSRVKTLWDIPYYQISPVVESSAAAKQKKILC